MLFARIRYLRALIRGFFMKRKLKVKCKELKVYGKCRLINKNCEISFGDRIVVYPNAKISVVGDNKKAELVIEDHVVIGPNTQIHVGDKVIIGEDTMISWGCTIIDRDYHKLNSETEKTRPINIGKSVWICCNATIMKGVTIGEGSVVASGAVVTKDVPPHCVVAGNPAKIVKENIYWKP